MGGVVSRMRVADEYLQHAFVIKACHNQEDDSEHYESDSQRVSFHGRKVSKARLMAPAAAQYQP